MKIVSLFFFFFIIGCKVEDTKQKEEDIKQIIERLECPMFNNQSLPSDSN